MCHFKHDFGGQNLPPDKNTYVIDANGGVKGSNPSMTGQLQLGSTSENCPAQPCGTIKGTYPSGIVEYVAMVDGKLDVRHHVPGGSFCCSAVAKGTGTCRRSLSLSLSRAHARAHAHAHAHTHTHTQKTVHGHSPMRHCV